MGPRRTSIGYSATARMPPRFHILAIAEGHILGVFRDEWDLESVAKIPFSFAGGC